MPDSATRTLPDGISGASRTARAVSTSNVTRSRWFTPISVAPTAEGPFQLRLVVDLHQRVEAQLAGERVKVRQLVVVERGNDAGAPRRRP